MNGSLDHRSMAILEDALRTYPLEPVPASLKTRVMNRIRPQSFVPRFTFPWLETAISLMVSTLLTVVVTLLLEIPPAAAVRLQNSVRIFLLQPGSRSIIQAAPTSAILAAMCLVLAVMLFQKPFAPRVSSHR
jgi:hypothetical protein